MTKRKKAVRLLSTFLLVVMLSTSITNIPGSFLQVVHAEQAPVLDSLSLSGMALSPAFDPNTTSYTATVDYSVNSATVTAGTSAAGISIDPADLGTKSLVPGKNKWTVNLTDGASILNTYTITVDKFVRIDERDPKISYSEGWILTDGQGDYNATLSAHNIAGNYTEFTGYFSRVIMGTRMGPGAGIVDLYLDGTFVKKVDLYKSSVTYKLTMYDSGDITPGQHTIRMVATGDKNSRATGAYANFDYIDYIPSVSSINISSQSGVSMIHTKDGTLQMVADVFPAEAAVERSVTWSVYDGTGSEKVFPSTRAAISPTGLLTAKDDGTVTVMATAEDGSGVLSNEHSVNISGQNGAGDIPVSSIAVSSGTVESIIPSKGGSLQMVADVWPADATDPSVAWSVTNGSGSATIDANGLLTAVSKGTVTVKATAKDGSNAGSNEYTVAIAYPTTTFNNPIKINRGGDPQVLKADDGYYYMIVTEGAGRNNRITLRRSKSMAGIAYGEQKVVFQMPAAENDVWAGEIYQLDGKWYIYYNSTRSGDAGRRMHVLECTDADPMSGTWTYKGQVNDSANENAIDGSVFEVNGNLYMLWSGKYDAARTPSDHQRIYIAHMSNPWTIDTERAMISEPTEAWERHGHPVNEGPIALVKNGKVYITFSGSFYQTNYYALGLLTANQNDNLLNPASWTKTGPVFTGSPADGLVSTGHNGFFPSADGTEDWFIYHSVSELNQPPNERDVRMQKITWDGDVPNFGVAVPNTTELPLPSGEAASDKYEAENATISGATKLTTSTPGDYDGFTGNGYAIYDNAAGDSVAFHVAATTTGTYKISFRYSNGTEDTQYMKLTVNGTVVDNEFAFPTTSNGYDEKGMSYFNYSLADKDVALNRGANTVTLESNGSNGLRLDSLVVPELGENQVKPVTSITVISQNGASSITTKGGTLQMQAVVSPVDATDDSVNWTVENGTGSATISPTGQLIAQTDGTVTVRATSVSTPSVSGIYNVDISGQGDIVVAEGEAYLMSYFRSDVSQTGQRDQDLHYSYSRDGIRWYELNKNLPVEVSFTAELRDPFIAKDKNGIYRLLFTSPKLNSNGTNIVDNKIGYAESTDLITWTNFQLLDVMRNYKEAGTAVYNSWAPEWSYDPVNDEYVLFWSSTLNSTAPNNNKHYYATTKDWVTYSDAKLLFDAPHKNIDANMYWIDADEEIDNQRVRDKLSIPADQVIPGNDIWFMYYKDETPESQSGMRTRETWSAKGILDGGEYLAHLSDYTTPVRTEGPTVFKVGDKWHMTYDYWWAGKFGLKTTTDITNSLAWSEENMDLRIPYRARHSGMTTLDNQAIWKLIDKYSLEARYSFNEEAADSSGHHYDGEVLGDLSFTSLNEGKAGYAQFDGVGDAVKLNHLDDSFYIRSVSMWVKAGETDRTQMLYHEGDKANGGLALKIEGNELIAGVSKTDVSKEVRTAFYDTDWHHVVVVYEEGIIKLYVDGVLKNSLDTGFQPKQSTLNQDGSAPKSRDPELYDVETISQTALLGTGTEQDVFGGSSANADYNGNMGEVQIFTVPLFEKDIADLYQMNKEVYVDKTALAAKVAEAEALVEANYTADSWLVLQTSLSEAANVMANSEAVQAEIDAALTNLQSAIDGLEERAPTPTPSPVTGSPVPEAPKPQVSDDGTIVVALKPMTRTGSSATAAVSMSVLEKAIAMAEADANGVKKVTLHVTETDDAKEYIVELPSDAVTLTSNKKKYELRTPIGSVTIPENMLASESIGGAGQVKISIGAADKANLDAAMYAQIGDRPLIELHVSAGDKLVEWNNADAPVTVSIPYTPTAEERKDPEHIVVWYIDGQGKVHSVPNGRYDEETGSVVFSTTHFSQYAVVYVKKSFEDTAGYPWAAKPIEVLASQGIISGVSENRFAPEENITRADFMMLLSKTLDLKAAFTTNFDDVPEGSYYYEALGIAKALGIADGVGDNRFNPEEYITRQDMMVMAARALEWKGLLKSGQSETVLNKFEDQPYIADYARESIMALVGAGLIEGAGKSIHPGQNTTRAEAAVFLYRMYNQ